MAVTYDQLISTLGRINDRLNAVDKRFDDLSRFSAGRDGASDGDSEVIRKALRGARGKAHSVGPDGTIYDVFAGIDERRAKALGPDFCQFIRDVAYASAPQIFNVSDPARVCKNLEMVGARPIQKTAMAEGSGATGGYLMPTQFSSELIRLAAEESFLRQLCRNIPMTNRTLLVPVLDQTGTPATGQSIFYGGLIWTWQPEATNYQTAAETEPKFRQVELVARDLVGIVIASNQLLQDNVVALDTILTTIFKEAMGWAYDYFFLQGLGTNQPLGMLNAAAAISITRQSTSNIQILDLAQMLSRMVPSSYKSCVWIIHPSVIPQLVNMQTIQGTSGPLVWVNPYGQGKDGPLAADLPGTILGRPMYISEKLPKWAASTTSTGSIVLIDPSKYLVGDRMAIQIEASPYPNFVKNQMTWRIIARFDGQPMLSAAITLADGSYTVSPYVLFAQS